MLATDRNGALAFLARFEGGLGEDVGPVAFTVVSLPEERWQNFSLAAGDLAFGPLRLELPA